MKDKPNPRGQPRRFKTGDELIEAMTEYLNIAKEKSEFPNVAGFCVYAQISRETLNKQKEYFTDAYKKVNDMLESAVMSCPYKDALKIFYLKNKFGFRDQVENKITVPEPITTINYDNMSVDDLIALRAILDKSKDE